MERVAWDDARWDFQMANTDNEVQSELMKREMNKKK